MQTSPQHQTLYQSILEEAITGGQTLMARLVQAALRSLHTREQTAGSHYEREALAKQIRLLQSQEAALCTRYPTALRQAFFNRQTDSKKATEPLLSVSDMRFEQLELMDAQQVQKSVAVAHAQQNALQAAQDSMTELTELICGIQGLPSVRTESNPLRTEAYVQALTRTIEQLDLADAIRLDWLTDMSAALGPELHTLYRALCQRLRQHGVVAASYTVASSPVAPVMTRQTVSAPAPAQASNETLLTLDKLRRLLAGELEPAPQAATGNRLQSFSLQFAKQFDASRDGSESAPPAADFAATVPAALEALAEMQQVDQVVQRLQDRRSGQAPASTEHDAPIEAIRDILRRSATGVAQGLSLEVVTLMVDNIVRNPRLLPPIQRLIAELEPALLLLSLVDPRFFIDKQHPARQLLQEITDRSLAYASVQANGFAEYLADVQRVVAPLGSTTIDNAEPFEQALDQLRSIWRRTVQSHQPEHIAAVQALERAEQRHLLALSIAREVEAHPHATEVPELILDFLRGPWAQVVAQARLGEDQKSNKADKYHALIAALLWSVHPVLARNNIPKLTQLMPPLLATLREGLDTMHYPGTKTSTFLAALMGLHQQIFRASAPPLPPPPATVRAIAQDRPWIAPAEAKASNFMELEDELPDMAEPSAALANVSPPLPAGDWPIGTWVELLLNERWVRTQLTWASPQGTLFLFTSIFGTTQSMARHTRNKLVQSGQLRLATRQTLVDGALDAVASIAMRNSVDSTY